MQQKIRAMQPLLQPGIFTCDSCKTLRHFWLGAPSNKETSCCSRTNLVYRNGREWASMTTDKPKKFVGVERWRLDIELSQSACLPSPSPPTSLILAAFEPSGPSCLASALASLSLLVMPCLWSSFIWIPSLCPRFGFASTVSSQIPNRLSKRCLKQKNNFYVSSSKKRRGCKDRREERCASGWFPALLGIAVAGMSDSTWASVHQTEQACVYPNQSLVSHACN